MIVSETLTDDLRNDSAESSAIVQVFTMVVTEGLLIEIAEQMERLDTNVSTFEPSLGKRPKVFNAVRMDIAVNVALCVIDHLMDVISAQAVVGAPSVAVNVRTALNILPHESLKRRAASVLDMAQANFLGIAIQQTHYNLFAAAIPASACNFGFLVFVHES